MPWPLTSPTFPVPAAATPEDAAALAVDEALLGFNVRDEQGRRVDPTAARVTVRDADPSRKSYCVRSDRAPLIGETPIPHDVAACLERSIGGYIGAAPDDVKVSNVSLAGSALSFTLTLPPYPEIVIAPLPPDVAAILAEHPTWDIEAAYEERDRRANDEP